MMNTFENKGEGEQNVAQGDGAVGKQENAEQEVDGDSHIFSGTGNVTVNQGLRMTPRTAVLTLVLLAGIGGGAYYLVEKNSISITGDNKGIAVIAGGNVTVNNPPVPPDMLAKYAEELGATKQLISTFFGTLLKEKVPRDQWDAKLREIADTHKDLLARLATVQSEDPQVVKLKQEAGQAIEMGKYGKAEDLLNRAEARDLEAIEELEQTARQRRISAAETNADQAKLQRVQLRYAKAAEYWQKAAALLPEEKKKDRALYLSDAGYDLHRIAEYKKALPLWEQSLTLYREIGDRAGEGTTLNNISQIYMARGDYDTALKYLEQSLVIQQEIGDRAGEGTTLNNLATTAYAKGDYDTALKYLEQSLVIRREIGDRAGEAVTSWNIGHIYKDQGDLAKAEQYMARTVEIDEAIGHPDLESDRKALEELRAKLSQ